jgi:hypothetical protein
MKKALLFIFSCVVISHASAQKIEITAGVHTGFMHYAGSDAQSVSALNSPDQQNGYTNNPYGNKTGTGFGGSIQAQLIVIKSFIIGLQGSYEALKSKVDINSASISAPTNHNVTGIGSTSLKTNYLSVNPYIGYRLPIPVIKVDILAGLDIAHITDAREKGSMRGSDGEVYTTNRDRKTRTTDNRVKFGLAAAYNRVGITASYSHGLSNYFDGYIGGPAMEAHSEVIRLGLSYRIF